MIIRYAASIIIRLGTDRKTSLPNHRDLIGSAVMISPQAAGYTHSFLCGPKPHRLSQ